MDKFRSRAAVGESDEQAILTFRMSRSAREDPFAGSFHEVFARNQLINHAVFQGLFGGDGLAGENDVQSFGQTNQARQPSGTAPGRKNSKLRFRQADFSGFVG